MPIIQVDAIGEPSEFPADMAQKLADAVGGALKTGLRDTWVKVQFSPPSQYAENGVAAPVAERPLLVSILKYKNPTGSALDNQARELTRLIAEAAEHPPENVHLIYEPPGVNRVAFGGTVVR